MTKTQQDKERKSVMAAKAIVASEKKLAYDSKKLASDGLKEKKKQLLVSRKDERDAIKVAALQKKASASVLSTPGSTFPELSGICLHFPKKSKLMVNQSTPSGSMALAHSILSPQRKGDSPKKRPQLNQAPTSTPPCEYQATPPSSTSRSWSGLDDESEEDFSTEESEEEDSIELRALLHPPDHAVRWSAAPLVFRKARVFMEEYCCSVWLLCWRTEK